MKPTLKSDWIVRIFDRLRGVYGNQFKAKYSSIEDGVDVGMQNAMTVWGQELGQFQDKPECLAFALENLPTDHAPNAMEFRETCRRAPRKDLAIDHKHEPADPAKVAEITAKVTRALTDDRDHMAWAKFPASREAFDGLLKAAQRDTRLRAILEQHVTDGVCSAEYALQTIRRSGEWVAV